MTFLVLDSICKSLTSNPDKVIVQFSLARCLPLIVHLSITIESELKVLHQQNCKSICLLTQIIENHVVLTTLLFLWQIGRLLMRKVISDFTKIPYNEVLLKRTEKGKPFLVSKLILKPKFLSLESNHFTVKSKLCFCLSLIGQ